MIDSVVRGDNRLRILEIFVDGETSVTSETCTELARHIKSVIEDENLIDGNFRLDVSSPGIDRPIKFLLQYKKHINRSFELQYSVEEQIKNIKSKLTGIDDNILTFNDGKNEIRIRFEEIKSAKVLISF